MKKVRKLFPEVLTKGILLSLQNETLLEDIFLIWTLNLANKYVVYLRAINRHLRKKFFTFKEDAQSYWQVFGVFIVPVLYLIVTNNGNLIMTLYYTVHNYTLDQIFQGHFW